MRQTGSFGKSKNYLATLFLFLLTTLYTYVHKQLPISEFSGESATDDKAGDQLDESPKDARRRISIEDERIKSHVKLEASRATLPDR